VVHTRPPCDSTIERVIASPKPVPWGLVVKNALEVSSAFSGGHANGRLVRKRLRLHLPHRSTSMNFNGVFRCPEFARNLLIEHARDDHGNYLLLPAGERLKALSDFSYFFPVSAPVATPLQCDANSKRLSEIELSLLEFAVSITQSHSG
jgi:hypothetical protein